MGEGIYCSIVIPEDEPSGIFVWSGMTEDQKYMKHALELAEMGKGKTSPNPIVGAVVVRGGEIIGEGFHQKAGSDHAEVVALRAAGAGASGATLYLNLEPCSVAGKTPPCTDAIIKAVISRAVIATIDTNPLVAGGGIQKLRDSGIEVDLGTLENEAKKVNEIFFTYITKKRPFVLIKMAMSLDGRIATYAGQSRWISSEDCRRTVHRLRNEFDAVLVGIDTAIRDDPSLTARVEGFSNPLRIVIDSLARLPLSSNLVRSAREVPVLLATTSDASEEKLEELSDLGVTIMVLPSEDQKVNLDSLLAELGKMEITSLLVEGGSTVNWAFVKQGLVDKFLFFIAPSVIAGADAPSPVGGQGFARLEDSLKLRFGEVGFVGQDIMVEAYPEVQKSKVKSQKACPELVEGSKVQVKSEK